jgi:hypothetical protein
VGAGAVVVVAGAVVVVVGGEVAAACGSGGAESEGDRAGNDCGWSAAGTDAPAGRTASRVFMSSTR